MHEVSSPSAPPVTGELHREIQRLWEGAGRPSVRGIAQTVRDRDDLPDTVSHDTVARLLKGTAVPQWRKLRCVVTVLAEQSVQPVDIGGAVSDVYRLWAASASGSGSGVASERPYADGWIGAWDGGGDAVLAHASAAEFATWPPGVSRLDHLVQAVAELGAACEPLVARQVAARLVAGAAAEFGARHAKTLAARHALAFWTGQSGRWQEASQLTETVLTDCADLLGERHPLTRLARLRRALWRTYLGDWRGANRLYGEMAREESGADGDPRLLLLARWGRARTGGLAGNWSHADSELSEILPRFTEIYGADHPVCLDASVNYAWAMGRAGRAEDAFALLDGLLSSADPTAAIGHPAVLRLRVAHVHWKWQVTVLSEVSSEDAAAARAQAESVGRSCEDTLGAEHPVTLAALEVGAFVLFGSDRDEGARTLRHLARVRARLWGEDHPTSILSRVNQAIALAHVIGPQGAVSLFDEAVADLGRVLGLHHPEVIRARGNRLRARAEAWGPRGLDDEAVLLLRDARDHLGPEHPDTLWVQDLVVEVRAQQPARTSFDSSSSPDYSFGGGGDVGGGSGSDRRLKASVVPVDWTPPSGHGAAGDEAVNGHDLLARVRELPVSTWRYLWEPDDVRHLGPMAQDWHGSLGLGADDKVIRTVDVNGVALVAVQALARQLDELRRQVAELRRRCGEDEGGTPEP